MYPSDKRPRLDASGAAKKREKKRRLDNAVELRTTTFTTVDATQKDSLLSPARTATDACSRKNTPCTFWGNGNRTTMAMILANDEEAILSKLLVAR